MKSGILRDEVAARLAGRGSSGKLASISRHRHKRRMRNFVIVALLSIAACAPQPAATPPPEQSPPTPPPAGVDRHDHRMLNGMTANELIEHFGRPRLQIREGDGTKLQFAGASCVLDFYLYPAQGGVPRVSHIDARNLQGGDVTAQACVYEIERARGVR